MPLKSTPSLLEKEDKSFAITNEMLGYVINSCIKLILVLATNTNSKRFFQRAQERIDVNYNEIVERKQNFVLFCPGVALVFHHIHLALQPVQKIIYANSLVYRSHA